MLDASPEYLDPIKGLLAERAAAMCDGKEAFASPALAHKAAKRGRHKGIVREPYRCLCCNQWHIGAPTHVRRPKPEPLRLRKIRNRNGVRKAWGQE